LPEGPQEIELLVRHFIPNEFYLHFINDIGHPAFLVLLRFIILV